MDSILILHGNIVYSENLHSLRVLEDSYLISANGIVKGVYPQLPDEYKDCPYEEYGDKIIIPGMTDLHIHAPQYSFQGLGMDLELLEWLNTNTFPEEAKYNDLTYAKAAYSLFAERMKRSSTTRACIFGTIHCEATMLLMDLMEKTGICSMVGKVNMDRNSPDYLREDSAEQSAENTIQWLASVQDRHYKNTAPILTPRFIPSCSDPLMSKLHDIQREFDLPVQSHLSENQDEIAWVQELCPWSEFYGDAYDHFGLFGSGAKTVMAHCVYSDSREMERMKDNGVFIAHCPESNINLCSGVAPVREFLNRGLKVGLGSDVAAGSSENIFAAMAHAIQASKMRWRLLDSSLQPLTVPEAFFLATKGGGEFFGKAGSFEPGYEMDAVILDDSRLRHGAAQTVEKRLERMVYLADHREVASKYVRGNKLF